VSPKLQRLPRRRDDVRLHDRELRSYLVVPEGGVAHELNPTARAVWELCDGRTTVEEVVEAICQIFLVERDNATAGVVAIVGELEAAGLVGWADTPKEAS
jgi:hypothetical protein